MSNNFMSLCANSLLEKEFLSLLSNTSIKVVSFDIFDTLAIRSVAKPSYIFHHMGKKTKVLRIFNRPELFVQYRIEAEKKAREKHKELGEITLDMIYAQFHLTQDEKECLKSMEIEEETKKIFINKQILHWIKLSKEHGKKVVLTSDMYLSTEDIKAIVLSKIKESALISNIFISSECKKTKSKSDLYQHIVNELNIEFSELLHIGDNLHSDFHTPKKLGIHVIYYGKDSYIDEIIQIEEEYIDKNLKHTQSLRVLTSTLNPYQDEKEQFYYNYGATVMAPLLWEFSHWLKEVYESEKLDQINFLMREGKLFQKYLTKIEPSIKTNLVYASRASTYLPTFKDNDENWNFYKYRKLSIQDFYAMHKLKIENKILQGYVDTLFSEANKIYVDDRNLLDIFSEDINLQRSKISEIAKNEKNIFLRYLKEIDFQQNSAMVDFGGEGKTLKRITSILPEKHKLNILFYMHALGPKTMFEHKTFAFLTMNERTQKAIKILQRSPEFIENLLNGAEETTCTYEMKDDTIKPKTYFPSDNLDTVQEMDKAFQHGIDNFFTIAKQYKYSKRIDRDTLIQVLARSIDVPTAKETKYFGEHYYDEGNGSNMVSRLITQERIDYLQGLDIHSAYQKFSSNYFYKRQEIPWFQGILNTIDPKFMHSIKGLSSHINEHEINAILDILDVNLEVRKVNIYGAGKFFKDLKPYLDKRGIEIVSVIDSRAEIEDFTSEGYQVQILEQAINHRNTETIIISSVVFAIEITNKIIQYAQSNALDLKIINHFNGLIKDI